MINKIRNIESTFSIRKASIIIAVLTLFSRLTGFVRDRLFAGQFGAGTELDTYNAAFRIPDLTFNVLILGTLSAAFVPVLSGLLHKDPEKARDVAASIFNIVAIVMGAVTLLYIIFAKPLTRLIVPGFDDGQLQQTVDLSKIIIFSQFIFALSNVATNSLISKKKFLIANFAPALYNVGIIIGIMVLYPKYGLIGLSFGVVIGALLLFVVQIPELIKNGFTWRPVLMLKDPSIRRIGKLFWPRLFALDISYATLLIATIIGSTLVSGSITVFIFANNLQSVPIGIFALSTAVAAFPALSEKASSGNFKDYAALLSRSMVQILFFIIPLSILFLLYRAHIVRIILGTGKFNWEDTRMTFNALGAFAIAMFSQALVPLFSRAFYALHNTKTPVIVTLVAVVINAIVSYVFAQSLGILGVVLGFTIASIVSAVLLFFLLRRNIEQEAGDHAIVHALDVEVMEHTTKIIIATLGLGITAYGTLYLVAPLLNTRTALGLLIQVAISGGLATLVYFGIAKMFSLREAEDLFIWLKRIASYIR